MEMRKLGSDGPDISVVGYGAWEAGGDMWGPNESEEAVVEAIHAALDAGMTWIDTAEVYGNGRSERIVGRAIEGRRDELLVFTKVAPRPSGTGFRRDEVKRAIRASLERLGVERVDLYQLHWPARDVPVEETWEAMCEVQDEGLATHIGVSNFDRNLIERCRAIRDVTSLQNELSLLAQDDRDELLPWLADEGVGYLAYSPLGLGLLTGAISRDTKLEDFRGQERGGPSYFRPGNFERNLERVGKLRTVADRAGVSLATLALRWVLEQRGVTAAIAGSRNPKHVRANADAGSMTMEPSLREEIEAIFA